MSSGGSVSSMNSTLKNNRKQLPSKIKSGFKKNYHENTLVRKKGMKYTSILII